MRAFEGYLIPIRCAGERGSVGWLMITLLKQQSRIGPGWCCLSSASSFGLKVLYEDKMTEPALMHCLHSDLDCAMVSQNLREISIIWKASFMVSLKRLHGLPLLLGHDIGSFGNQLSVTRARNVANPSCSIITSMKFQLEALTTLIFVRLSCQLRSRFCECISNEISLKHSCACGLSKPQLRIGTLEWQLQSTFALSFGWWGHGCQRSFGEVFLSLHWHNRYSDWSFNCSDCRQVTDFTVWEMGDIFWSSVFNLDVWLWGTFVLGELVQDLGFPDIDG